MQYDEQDVEYAGFWRRLAASFIDSFLFSFLMGLVALIFFGQPLIHVDLETGGVTFWSENNWLDQIGMLLITVVMWVKFMGTPGKLLLGCHVLDAATLKPIGYGQAFLRYFAYLASIIPLGLGFLWIAWDKRKQGFHDKIAKTVVVLDSVHEFGDESAKSLDQLLKEVR